jgi:hypothetical protein
MDDVRRAYSTLGLPDSASLAAVRKRYRALVKTWHPDHFMADPQGRAEAAARMRVINAAYTRLKQELRSSASPRPEEVAQKRASKPQSASQQRRLTQEEIEAMVSAIGTETPLDSLLGAVGWTGSTFEAVLVGMALVALGFVLVGEMVRFGLPGLRRYPELPLFLGILIFLGLREYRHRRRLAAALRDEDSTGK